MSVWYLNSLVFSLYFSLQRCNSRFFVWILCAHVPTQLCLFLHPVCEGNGLMLFQSGTWPTNKRHPVDGKTVKGWGTPSPRHYQYNQNLTPNKDVVCIPHTLSACFLICLISAVVVDSRVLSVTSNSHFKFVLAVFLVSVALLLLLLFFVLFFPPPKKLDTIQLAMLKISLLWDK